MGFAATTTPTYAAATTVTTQNAGTTGTGAIVSNSLGGAYLLVNGVLASDTDKSIGFLSTVPYSSPRSTLVGFTNSSGGVITDLNLSFDYEKYRTGTRAFNMTFFTSADGSAWTPAGNGDGDQSYAADTTNTAIDPPTTNTKTFALSGLTVAAGSPLYLRWYYVGVLGSSSAQAIGIDNLVVTNTTVPVPEPASILGGVALAFGLVRVVRRRRRAG